MSMQLLFWVVMIISVLFSVVPQSPERDKYKLIGSIWVILLLIGLLGWKVFGPAIHQ